MKKYLLKNRNRGLSVLFLFFIAIALIINSCKKDQTYNITDSKVLQAKTWYENTYSQKNLASRSFSGLTSSSNLGIQNKNFDFTQYIKPNWSNASVYNRLGEDVVELPVDSSATIAAGIKTGVATVYNKSSSHTSFLLLNDGKNFSAYIMMIVADYLFKK